MYVCVHACVQGYKDEMLNPEMQPLIPINLYGKSDLLFGNMEEIFRFHNDVFLRDLENCINTPELIGLCFVQRVCGTYTKRSISREGKSLLSATPRKCTLMPCRFFVAHLAI